MLATPINMQSHEPTTYAEEVNSTLEKILQGSLFPYSQSNTSTRHNAQAPEILSASQYPQGLIQDEPTENPTRKRRKASQQLYGGLISSNSKSLNDSASEDLDAVSPLENESSRPRKKSKRLASQDEDANLAARDKKQRGRPRLDTQDETAADRRRTQIRLAQRAYRHRKESTISGLKKRVSSLQSTISEMHKTFIQLRDDTQELGLLSTRGNVVLAHQFKVAQEKFSSLAKIDSDPDTEDEIEDIIEMSRVGKRQRQPKSQSNRANILETPIFDHSVDMASSNSGIEDDEADINVSTNATASQMDLPLISTNDFAEATDFTRPFDNTFDLWAAPNSTASIQFDVAEVAEVASPTFPMTPTSEGFSQVERPLQNPHHPEGFYTYSFQEITFARRIHRMCLERAFRHLTNPSLDPSYIARTFRFTFCFTNRRRAIWKFQELLKRKAGENLENYSLPFIHIGGAGTHFPRRDVEGRPIYPPNMMDPAEVVYAGPQGYGDFENNMSDKSVPEILEAIGFGGEWYDCRDVEGYLQSMGIHLDGGSSFVEVSPRTIMMSPSSIGQSPLLVDSDSGTSSAGRSPFPIRTPSPLLQSNITSNHPQSQNQNENESYLDNDLFTQSAFPDMGMDTDLFASNHDLFSSLTNPKPTDPQKFSFPSSTTNQGGNTDLMKMLTFDVETFLSHLLQDAACLGRAPGFRKKSIDDAVRKSLSVAY